MDDAALYVSRPHTAPHQFTSGIEGPACDEVGVLYAVNFEFQGGIGAVTPDGDAHLFIQLPQGSVGNGIRFRRDGHMLIADHTGHNIYHVDMRSRKVSIFAHDASMHQPNDLCITGDGTVFASDPHWGDSTGRIWRCGHDGQLVVAADGLGTTNGIEISPDETTLYVNESVQRRIWAFKLGPDGGLSAKRLLHEFPDHGLDGMRCDIEGNLYVTRFGKGTIAKLAPDGRLIREISLHGTRPSNLAFGGEDGRVVYVTEVDHGRIEAFRVETPGREWMLWKD